MSTDIDMEDRPRRLAELALDAGTWERLFVGAIKREATGPGGEVATVRNTVLALRWWT